jgi:hypothetical protein
MGSFGGTGNSNLGGLAGGLGGSNSFVSGGLGQMSGSGSFMGSSGVGGSGGFGMGGSSNQGQNFGNRNFDMPASFNQMDERDFRGSGGNFNNGQVKMEPSMDRKQQESDTVVIRNVWPFQFKVWFDTVTFFYLLADTICHMANVERQV